MVLYAIISAYTFDNGRHIYFDKKLSVLLTFSLRLRLATEFYEKLLLCHECARMRGGGFRERLTFKNTTCWSSFNDQ